MRQLCKQEPASYPGIPAWICARNLAKMPLAAMPGMTTKQKPANNITVDSFLVNEPKKEFSLN